MDFLAGKLVSLFVYLFVCLFVVFYSSGIDTEFEDAK